MMTGLIKTTLALSVLLLATMACGPKNPPRVLAQGDPFDPLAFDRFEEAAVDPAANVPQRRINLPPNSQERAGLRVDMSISPTTITPGRTTFVHMTVRNTTMNSLTIPYSTEKRFDVIVFSDPEQRNPVYIHSETQFFAQLFQEVTLGPGSNLKRVIEIPTMTVDALPRDLARGLARPLLPGEYWVWGTHEGTPNLSTGPIKITVGE